MNVNIWGNAKKDHLISKNYVGYIPSDYINYGFKISVDRHRCNGNSQIAEEPYVLDMGGLSSYEIKITCPNSVKMWKFSYKLTSSPTYYKSSHSLKYILKGSNDNSNWNTIYNSIIVERILTLEEFESKRIKSIFPNILIENPKSYKYYIFIVSYNIHNIEHCSFSDNDIDNIPKAAAVSNFQLYIMNDYQAY